MAAEPVSDKEFSSIMAAAPFAKAAKVKKIAIGLSGGPDSMALALLLREWAGRRGIDVHALTVDHGLRPGSAAESKAVANIVRDWPSFRHSILRWRGPKPESRIMEEARVARYRLLAHYCAAKTIPYLFLAHHQDDQAETFLFRLSKGSGLDGLAGMQASHPYNQDLTLLRPLLGIEKARLQETCMVRKIAYIEDPSNDATVYFRPRLREARVVLEKEGLSAKRLAVTAARLARAKKSLDFMAEKAYKSAVLSDNTKHIVFDLNMVQGWPEDVILRIMLKAIERLGLKKDYPPRLEKIEKILEDFLSPASFRKRTFSGLIFERLDKRGEFKISREGQKKRR